MQIGDRVYLITEAYGNYGANPVKGGKYESQGTIEAMGKGTIDLSIRVIWDNGATNNYIERDLEVISTQMYKSIW